VAVMGTCEVCCMPQGAALIVAATSVAASTAFYAARGIGRPLAERVISSEMREVLRAGNLSALQQLKHCMTCIICLHCGGRRSLRTCAAAFGCSALLTSLCAPATSALGFVVYCHPSTTAHKRLTRAARGAAAARRRSCAA